MGTEERERKKKKHMRKVCKKRERKEKMRGIEEREEDGRKQGVQRKGCTTPPPFWTHSLAKS